jgi:lysophospholipase L1-like esterase
MNWRMRWLESPWADGRLAVCGFVCLLTTAAAAIGDEGAVTAEAAATPVAEMLADLHLLEPIWTSDTARRESVLFVADDPGRPATGKLLFPAAKILAIHTADGQTPFEIGRDAELSPDGRELILLPDSRIPHLQAADLFPPAGAPRTIQHKADDPQRHMLFDNAHWFHDQQVEVTYAHEPVEWPAATPKFAGEQLPRVLAKLRAGEPVTIGVSGDSISAGGNASGATKTPPWMPAFPELVAAQLEQSYKSDVTLHNRAVGGWVAPQGAGDLDALLATKPDLVIIAYGMNDVSYRNAEAFKGTIAGMLQRIRAANPETDVILVSPMTGHAAWVHTPQEMFPLYRDALASLAGPGVALADVTSIWQEMLRRKREVDLTGNGVNHPNDFGHRVYAQAILALLVEPHAAK